MTDLQKFIQVFQRLQKNKIGVDEEGRILLKINDEMISDNKNYPKYQSMTNDKKNLIFNQLFHPEERIPRKNITQWINQIICQIKILNNETTAAKLERLANIYNLSALIFCLMGQISRAKALCKYQIKFFYTHSQINLANLRFILQPWINLGRIDRLLGAFEQAINKFDTLKGFVSKQKFIHIDEYKINKKCLLNVIASDQRLLNVYKTCALFEPLKTKLMAKSYAEIYPLSYPYIKNKSFLSSIAYEACIISHAKQGNLPQAIKLCQQGLLNSFSRQYAKHFATKNLGI